MNSVISRSLANGENPIRVVIPWRSKKQISWALIDQQMRIDAWATFNIWTTSYTFAELIEVHRPTSATDCRSFERQRCSVRKYLERRCRNRREAFWSWLISWHSHVWSRNCVTIFSCEVQVRTVITANQDARSGNDFRGSRRSRDVQKLRIASARSRVQEEEPRKDPSGEPEWAASWKIGGLVLLEMDSVAVTVPLRQPTKKMKKRKELDALAPAHAISRRSSGKRSSQVINELWEIGFFFSKIRTSSGH